MAGMDYDEFKEFADSIKGLAKDYDKFLDNFLTKEGMRCLASTKRLTPVDMGALRNGWKLAGPFKRGKDRYVVIHNNLKYASFVEDGHIQNERFLPIEYLEDSTKGQMIAGSLKAKYGENIKGIKLKKKWVKGHHMARISLTRTQNKLDARFEKAFSDFCKGKGLG